MTKHDLKAFEKIMASLNEIYGDPSKPVSDLKMELYFSSLKDLTIEYLNRAVNILCNTKVIKTFPLPAEIREAALGNSEDQAEEAFEILIGTIKSVGPYRSVEFQDGIIGRVVSEMGGWEAVNDWAEDDRKWNRKNFCDLYRSFARRGIGHEPVKCIGISENYNIDNKGKFKKPLAEYGVSDEPVRIGGFEKQLRLITGEKKS